MYTTVSDTWRAPPTGRATTRPPAATVARVLPMLADERIVWLSTVRPDGTPHLVPTWFWWDGTALVVFSKPDAVKARNLRANPRLMVAVGDPEDDFSVGLIEAEATVVDGARRSPTPSSRSTRRSSGRAASTRRRSARLYTQSIRIVPTRFLAWHGRGEAPAPVAVARPSATAALAVSIAVRLDALSARLRGLGRRRSRRPRNASRAARWPGPSPPPMMETTPWDPAARPREMTPWTTSARCSARSSGGAGGTGGSPDLAAALGSLTGGEGGLEGLLAQLSNGGLGDEVGSWVGHRPRQARGPATAGQRARARTR